MQIQQVSLLANAEQQPPARSSPHVALNDSVCKVDGTERRCSGLMTVSLLCQWPLVSSCRGTTAAFVFPFRFLH